jgi:pyruvate dehydrogenase E1 component alpha subunit
MSVVFFGDGCFEEGVVHESMNFAALHRLPVIFVCENNEFSVYTHLAERQPVRPIHGIAAAHGLSALVGNGNDVEEVAVHARQAVDCVRNGKGPQFLELRTYRWREHCGPNFDDELAYRSAQTIERGQKDCPIERQRALLGRISPDVEPQIADIERVISQEINAAFDFALSSLIPTSNDAEDHVYA